MSSLELFDIVREINRYSGLPGIVFFMFFMKSTSANTRIVFYILLASFLADFVNFFVIKFIFRNGFIITNSWYIINYFLVSWLFLKLIPKRRMFVLLLSAVFIAGSVFSSIFYFSFLESNTFIKTFSSISFTLLTILAFLEVLNEGPTDSLSRYPVFWIITGIFLFSSITLLKNLFQNYLQSILEISKSSYAYVHMFNNVFNIIKNLMFFFAFVLVKKGFPDYIQDQKSTVIK